MKHTKGKWEVKDNKIIGQIAIDSDLWKGICFLNYQEHRGKDNADEQRANAKLIAAAPELLTMLIDILEIVEYDGALTDEATTVIDDIRSRIAKATN